MRDLGAQASQGSKKAGRRKRWDEAEVESGRITVDNDHAFGAVEQGVDIAGCQSILWIAEEVTSSLC